MPNYFGKYPFEEDLGPMMGGQSIMPPMNPYIQGEPGAYVYSPPELGEEAKRSALKRALFSAGMSILSGMRPTPLPQSPMANIGQAGLAGLAEYNAQEREQFNRARDLAISGLGRQGAAAATKLYPASADLKAFTEYYYGPRATSNEGLQFVLSELETRPEVKAMYDDFISKRSKLRAVESFIPFGLTSQGDVLKFGRRQGDIGYSKEEIPKGTQIQSQFIQSVPSEPFRVPGELRPIIAPPAPNEAVQTMSSLNTLLTFLGDIKRLQNDEWIGPVAGRYGRVQEKVGGTVPLLKQPTPKQAEFYGALQKAFNMIGELRSGKVLTENELARLQAELPTANQPINVFNARMKNFEKELLNIIKERKRMYGEVGYRGSSAFEPPARTIIRRGKKKGRPVIQYSDGSIEYAK